MALRDTASRLLRKFGDPSELKWTTDGDVNPATGDVITPPTPASATAWGYPGAYNSYDLQNTNIERDDVLFYCEATEELPKKGWRCELLGITYRVMHVEQIRAKQVLVMTILQLRND